MDRRWCRDYDSDLNLDGQDRVGPRIQALVFSIVVSTYWYMLFAYTTGRDYHPFVLRAPLALDFLVRFQPDSTAVDPKYIISSIRGGAQPSQIRSGDVALDQYPFPPIFAALVSKSNSCQELLQKAISLRRSAAPFRSWVATLHEYVRRDPIRGAEQVEGKLRKIAMDLSRELGTPNLEGASIAVGPISLPIAIPKFLFKAVPGLTGRHYFFLRDVLQEADRVHHLSPHLSRFFQDSDFSDT